MTFKHFWDKRRKENPGEPKYISLCYVLQYSGQDKTEIGNIFDTYMVVTKDYDSNERTEMVDYLVDISRDM